MKKATFAQICIAITLVAVVLVAVFVMLVPQCGAVANAVQLPAFVIRTTDGYTWQLLKNDTLIDTYEGDFFDYGNQNAVAVKMKRAIASQLVLDGIVDEEYANQFALHDKYTLSFELPQVQTRIYGTDTNKYTQKDDSAIIIMGDYQLAIANTARGELQYTSLGADEYSYCTTSSAGSGLRFGQYISVGDYNVRYVAIEEFEFDGAHRQALRYGNSVVCHITSANPVVPQNATAQITYGAKIADIASVVTAQYDESISTDGGVWQLSNEQSGEFLGIHNLEDVLLVAGNYQLTFDFIPANHNYSIASGIVVDVTVLPKRIAVYIEDAYSLVGEELVDVSSISFEIDQSQLVGDDSLDMLGVSLSVENIDKNVVGSYTIKATFENENYEPYCLNYNSQFVFGGRYTVYAKKVQVTASDGKIFEVLCGDGFVNMTIKINDVDVQSPFDNKQIVKAYQIAFETYNGESVTPDSEYTVAWQDDVQGALWVYIEGGSLHDAQSTHDVTLMPNQDMIYFLCDESGVSGILNAKNIALLVICCVLVVAILSVVVAYNKRRRCLK